MVKKKKKKTSDVPVWRKFTLSPEEASEYFGIGINKIRKIIANNKTADFILNNNSRSRIFREKFEEYLLTHNDI